MPKIQRLSPELISQIAAGEVVERPSSVVKELVENAIDAGARSIDVCLKAGGQELIAVSDDGVGMEPEDARLAFERHATSKLRSAADLERIDTLGFRGEALPSIGAVARVRLVTAVVGAASGVELFVEEGAIRQVREIGRPTGTTVEVGQLFYHTPARRKFLRSSATELAKIQEVVVQQALANPEIGFRVVHQGRELLHAPAAATLKERASQLFGVEWSKSMLAIEGSAGGVDIRGVISVPPSSWPHRRFQHWVVNRRPIRSQLLSHALYEGYLSLLRRGQHPAAMLHLTLDPANVDVNIHPAKLEVRFVRPQQIHTLLSELVADRIGVPTRISKSTVGPRPSTDAFPYASDRAGERPTSMRQGAEEMTRFVTNAPRGAGIVREPSSSERQSGEREAPAAVSLLTESPQTLLPEPVIELLGQVHRTYVAAVVEGRLEILDQHAAHERWLFETLMDQLSSAVTAGTIAAQPRLVPQTIHLPTEVVTMLADQQPLLARLGLECEPFGRDAVLVRSTPAVLAHVPLEPFLIDLVESWLEGEEASSDRSSREPTEAASRRLLHGVVATMACHGAIKANQPLTREEMEHLLRTLHRRSLPPTCPHGRPLRVTFDRERLEQLFHRR